MEKNNKLSKRVFKTKEISTVITPEPTPVCYICKKAKPKSKLQYMSQGMYRCATGSCVDIIVLKCLKRYGCKYSKIDTPSS